MRDLDRKIELFRALFPRLSSFETNDWEENFLVEFTHDSTSIEGNTLTLIETKMILTDAVVPSETSLRELDEVRGHADAWQFVKDCVRGGKPLSETMIKDIHERVLPALRAPGPPVVNGRFDSYDSINNIAVRGLESLFSFLIGDSRAVSYKFNLL